MSPVVVSKEDKLVVTNDPEFERTTDCRNFDQSTRLFLRLRGGTGGTGGGRGGRAGGGRGGVHPITLTYCRLILAIKSRWKN